MLRKNLIWIFFIATMLSLVAFLNDSSIAQATAQMDAMAESQYGLSIAPPNLGLDGGLFTRGDIDKNSAYLQTQTSHSTGTSYDPLRAIKMTAYTKEHGAIWSNVEDGNYVDITKKQTLSCWMYFGPKKHTNSGDDFGDGMALVLQNSDAGIKAFSHLGTTLGQGETLGAWGIDQNTASAQTIADTAIQNSWALEFDTFANKTAGVGTDFDANVSGQHIAYGYPGEAGTYIRQGNGGLFGSYYYQQAHINYKPVELHDGTWHHLTLTWHPDGFYITYAFNDKNTDGTPRSDGFTERINDVSAAHFGGHAALAAVKNRLRWGFTATTGGGYEANLIAFESIPSSVESEVSSDIIDKTQNKTIDSKSTDKKVNSGDDLGINYHLKYDSGHDKWSKNVATLKLPSNVTYTADADGAIGYVSYDDGSDSKAEPILSSEYNSSTNTVTHTLQKDLYTDKPTNATIMINGKANSVNTDTAVSAEHANFTSPTLITDTETPSFTIQKAKPINLVLDQSNISVDTGKSANITGTVNYTDNTAPINSKVNVHATLNGTALDTFSMGDSTNLTNATAGKLSFNIPATQLTLPTNILKVYVIDANGNVSTTSTVTIANKGGLALQVDDYSFGDINQATASMLIPRKNTWNIIVDDTREDGTKSPWSLGVKTAGLYSGVNKFNGNVIFKKSDGTETNVSGDSYCMIASGSKTQTGEQKTNVGSYWNSDDGLMLKSTGLNQAGKYIATMAWTLADTPQ